MPRRKTNNTKLLQVWLTPEMYAALDRLAEKRSTTIAEIMRQQVALVLVREMTGHEAAA